VNLQKTLVFRNALKAEREFFCSSVFLEAGLAKWRRRKGIQTLEWLDDENKLNKRKRGGANLHG